MKKKINNRLLHSLCLVLLTGILCGCIDEREHSEIPTGTRIEKSVTFSVKVPGTSMPDTYAMTEDDENEIKEIVVLLFNTSGYTYAPLWCNTINSTPGNSAQKNFTVKVPEGTYDMMVLANANQSLSTALTAATNPIAIGDNKATVISKLLLSNSGKWNANTGTYTPIPMWSEINGLTVDNTLSGTISTTLVRMLAKIDVALTTTVAKSNFKLKSVRLYNYNNKGQVVPNSSTWNVNPSVPASASKPAIPATSPLIYNTMTTSDVACINEIYTFEANVGSSANHLTNTCLVVGGIYMGDTAPTYYRIDFANTASSVTTYLPLLRNHSYSVNITDVSGSGLTDPEDAFKSRPVKIEAKILAWNDGEMSDVVSDGQHKLGVSQGEFTFTREARTTSSPDNVLSIITNYPEGWKVEKIVDGANAPITWLNLDPDNDDSGATVNTRVLLTANAGSTRVGFIHLSAGRLTYVVKVTQNTNDAFMLTVRDAATNSKDITDLLFLSKSGRIADAKSVYLNWLPASQTVAVTTAKVGTNPEFVYNSLSSTDRPGTTGQTSYPGGSGSKYLNIQPEAFTISASDPFAERISKLEFTLNNGTRMLTKSLFIRHVLYNAVSVVEPIYIMSGGTRSFAVRANTPFTIEIDNTTNTGNVITSVTTTGAANTTAAGTPVNFDIINDLAGTPVIVQRDVKVTIKSPNNLFDPVPVTLKCISAIAQPKSNSYIVKPGGTPILIPVSRANESILGSSRLGADQVFTASLVWTDNSKKIATDSNIAQVTAVGTGPTGHLLVTPGTGQGNAVVAIRDGSNRVIWSWHIWVTSETPTVSPASGGTFMDRNLGAIGKTAGAVGTLGLLYQWGRKDPFPGALTISSNSVAFTYNATGQLSFANVPLSNSNNLSYSVENPTNFIYNAGGGAPFDWYTDRNNGQNHTLWDNGTTTKTVYDPCPVGWRVPLFSSNTSPWSSLTTSNFTWHNTNKGRTANSHGGFYPATGYRTANGSLDNVGTMGYCWGASPNGTKGYYMYFTDSYVDMKYMSNRVNAFPVRCVKEP